MFSLFPSKTFVKYMKRKQTHAPWTAIAEVELTYKSRVRTSERPSVSNSRESFEVFLQVWQAGRIELLEEFKVMLLNRANKEKYRAKDNPERKYAEYLSAKNREAS